MHCLYYLPTVLLQSASRCLEYAIIPAVRGSVGKVGLAEDFTAVNAERRRHADLLVPVSDWLEHHTMYMLYSSTFCSQEVAEQS